jgi:hypothetical protein
MYKKKLKIPFICKKELKPHNIVLVIFPIFLHPVEHDCTTPIKHPYKMLYQHQDKCRQDKKRKVGELTCTLDK